jgi:mRNA interferase MazF
VNIATAEGKQTELITDSVIMTDNLATVLDTEIDKVIGFWSEMSLVDAALRHTLEI